MHIRLIAVGDRQAEWVTTAVRSYVERLPADWRFRVDQLPTARRAKRDGSARAVEAEGKAILGRVAGDEQLILRAYQQAFGKKARGLASRRPRYRFCDRRAGRSVESLP